MMIKMKKDFVNLCNYIKYQIFKG